MRACDLSSTIIFLVGFVWTTTTTTTTRAADFSQCESDEVATGVRVLGNGTAILLCEKPACTNWKLPALFPDCVRAEYCERNQYVMAIAEKPDDRRKKKRKDERRRKSRNRPSSRRTARKKFSLNCCKSAVKFSKAVRTIFLRPGESASGGYTFLKASSEFLLVSGIDRFPLKKKGHSVYRTIFSRVRCDLAIFLGELKRH